MDVKGKLVLEAPNVDPSDSNCSYTNNPETECPFIFLLYVSVKVDVIL
jgi:hypothetical protein